MPMLRKLKKKDPTFESEQAFKDLMKAYTHDSCYYKIGLRFNQGRFNDI